MNGLMRLSLVTFLVSLGVWGLVAVWNHIRIYDLLLTCQQIAFALAIVSGLAMLALLVDAAWLRFGSLGRRSARARSRRQSNCARLYELPPR